MAKYSIIGSGISGLSIGYFLKKAGHNVTIYEADSFCGGVIKTEKVAEGLVQHGPHLMRANEEIDKFFQEIGVKTLQAIRKKKYIGVFKNDNFEAIKLGMSQIFRTIPHLFFKRKKNYDSLLDFASHHYGKFVAENFIQAICNGVYACDIKNLNCKIALKKLYFEEERAIFKIVKSLVNFKKQKIVTPVDGFGGIVESLAKNLKENIVYNVRIEDIEKLDGSVVIAIPAFCAKKLHGLPSGVNDLLENISYASVDVTTVFTKTPIKLHGIGILTPQKDGILGILFNSSAFYLKVENGFYSYSIFSKNLQEGEITKMFERIYNVEIVNSYFNSYKNSIPIYNDALEKFIDYNGTSNERVRFFGNYTGQVAIGEIILNAKEFANNVI